MQRFSIAIGAAVALAACSPKMAAEPDLVTTVARSWQSLGDCIYTDLTTVQGQPAGLVSYVKLEAEQAATIGVAHQNDGGAFTYRIAAKGAGQSSVSVWSRVTFPPDFYRDLAMVSLRNCTPK